MHLQLLQHLHEQQPPEFEEGQQAMKSCVCLFAGKLHDFLLPPDVVNPWNSLLTGQAIVYC